MATIKEIALLAGVSTTTVSNVIHGKKRKASQEVQERISRLVQELNYVEKLGLRHLNNSRSQIICFVVNPQRLYENTVFTDPFYGQILGVIEKRLHEKAYYLMVYASADVDEIFHTAAAWNIDGIIALSFQASDCAKLTALTGKPLVSIDVIGSVGEHFVNVGLNDGEGGYLMTRYLLHAGYEDIWLLANKDIGVDHERFLGCMRAFDEASLPFKHERYVMLDDNHEKRLACYQALLPQWAEADKQQALFFFADSYALEAISFLREQGLQVPENIAIAGYDDIQYAGISNPPLTTVRQDISLKAEKAIEQLFRLLDGKPIEERDIRLPVEIVARHSSRYCKR